MFCEEDSVILWIFFIVGFLCGMDRKQFRFRFNFGHKFRKFRHRVSSLASSRCVDFCVDLYLLHRQHWAVFVYFRFNDKNRTLSKLLIFYLYYQFGKKPSSDNLELYQLLPCFMLSRVFKSRPHLSILYTGHVIQMDPCIIKQFKPFWYSFDNFDLILIFIPIWIGYCKHNCIYLLFTPDFSLKLVKIVHRNDSFREGGGNWPDSWWPSVPGFWDTQTQLKIFMLRLPWFS